ncbi:hypothetical protein [Thermocatellispora tengchongensis]|uniref:hypothetical protein n=1 Tax=Thermocatellispora tengchongensis TaxID=1073253 RepID=UPI00363F562B
MPPTLTSSALAGGLAATVAAFLAGVAIIPGSAATSVSVAGALIVASALAWRSGSAPALRTVIVVDLVVLFALAGAHLLDGAVLVWPVTVLLALGVAHLVNRRAPAPHPTSEWLRRGRLTPNCPGSWRSPWWRAPSPSSPGPASPTRRPRRSSPAWATARPGCWCSSSSPSPR